MVAFKTLITDSLWKVAKNLIRDYSELELLQSGSRGNEKFVERSIFRAKETFTKELESFKFSSLQFSDSIKPLDKDGIHILIAPLDGSQNLSKAFPFFGSTIIQIKKEDGEESIMACVISFPALGQIFFAEKGQGAWMEKYEDSGRAMGRRLRVSNVKELSESFVSSKFAIAGYSKISLTREFGSNAYDIAAYASGKLDAILIESDDHIHKLAAELFAKEAGGVIRAHDNKDLIATNSLLASSIK